MFSYAIHVEIRYIRLHRNVWDGWIMKLYPEIYKKNSTVQFRAKSDNAGSYESCISCAPATINDSEHVFIRGGLVGVTQDLEDGSLRMVRGYHVESRDIAAENKRDLHDKLVNPLCIEMMSLTVEEQRAFDEYDRRKDMLKRIRLQFEDLTGGKSVEVSMVDDFLEFNLGTQVPDEYFFDRVRVEIFCKQADLDRITRLTTYTNYKHVTITEEL